MSQISMIGSRFGQKASTKLMYCKNSSYLLLFVDGQTCTGNRELHNKHHKQDDHVLRFTVKVVISSKQSSWKTMSQYHCTLVESRRQFTGWKQQSAVSLQGWLICEIWCCSGSYCTCIYEWKLDFPKHWGAMTIQWYIYTACGLIMTLKFINKQ